MRNALNKLKDQGHEVIVGTQNTPDYIVLARHPKTGAKVGVKVMFGPTSTEQGGMPTLFMRIRLAKVSEAEILSFTGEKSVAAFPDADNWAASYPDMPWQKTSEVRRSMVVGVASPRQGKENLWMMPYDFDAAGTFNDIREWLTSKVPRAHWKISTGQFKDFLRDALTELLDQAPQPPTKESIQAQIDVHKNALVALAAQLEATTGSVKDLLTPLEGTITPVDMADKLPDYWAGSEKPSLTLHEGGSGGEEDAAEDGAFDVDDDDKEDDPTIF